jgi:formylglycine-generating enzyme required for sulfatase activity
MHGNCWEWCADRFGEEHDPPHAAGSAHAREVAGARSNAPEPRIRNGEHSANANPRGAEFGSARVLRGGSWRLDAVHCRSAHRFSRRPSLRLAYVGFRVSRTL